MYVLYLNKILSSYRKISQLLIPGEALDADLPIPDAGLEGGT